MSRPAKRSRMWRLLRGVLVALALLAWVAVVPAWADQAQDYRFQASLEMPHQPGDPLKFTATVMPSGINAPEIIYYVVLVGPDGNELERVGPNRVKAMQDSVIEQRSVFQNGTYFLRILRQVGSTLVPVAQASGTTDIAEARTAHVRVIGLVLNPMPPQAEQPTQIEVTAVNEGDAPGSASVPVVFTSLSDGSRQAIGTAVFTDLPPGQRSTLGLNWTPSDPVAPGRLDALAEGRGVTVQWDAAEQTQAVSADGNPPSDTPDADSSDPGEGSGS